MVMEMQGTSGVVAGLFPSVIRYRRFSLLKKISQGLNVLPQLILTVIQDICQPLHAGRIRA